MVVVHWFNYHNVPGDCSSFGSSYL